MEYQIVTKGPFVLVGYSAKGKWRGEVVHPIPELWERASAFIHEHQAEKIVGVCLPPRNDDYYYTCGLELNEVDYDRIKNGTTLHTFPEQTYAVFKHKGHAKEIPNTYGELWKVFDQDGLKIKKGMPEIESVESRFFGKEDTEDYEMEIWVPIE